MATNCLTYKEIIEQARKTWPGKEGDKRAERVKNLLDSVLENYSQNTGFSKEELLNAFEKIRTYNTVNFYQSSNFPLFQGENVFVFQSVKDFRKRFPSGKYLCPSCEKESSDPYKCSQVNCDWKVYGLLRDLGKGINVVIKDDFLKHPKPILIFKPIELS